MLIRETTGISLPFARETTTIILMVITMTKDYFIRLINTYGLSVAKAIAEECGIDYNTLQQWEN